MSTLLICNSRCSTWMWIVRNFWEGATVQLCENQLSHSEFCIIYAAVYTVNSLQWLSNMELTEWEKENAVCDQVEHVQWGVRGGPPQVTPSRDWHPTKIKYFVVAPGDTNLSDATEHVAICRTCWCKFVQQRPHVRCVCLFPSSTLWTIKMSPFYYLNNFQKNQQRIPPCGSGVCVVYQNRPTPFPGWMS